jgi:hypothetical protein
MLETRSQHFKAEKAYRCRVLLPCHVEPRSARSFVQRETLGSTCAAFCQYLILPNMLVRAVDAQSVLGVVFLSEPCCGA